MRLLLDTHIALWAIADSPQLPQQARRLILDAGSERLQLVTHDGQMARYEADIVLV